MRYRDTLVLHSFPTRRSSDLLRTESTSTRAESNPARARRRSPRSRCAQAAYRDLGQKNGCPSNASARDARSTRSRLSRSEEHTSELQSRQYLVCRLLLEKKKK